MNLSDIATAVTQQLSVSILPESKWPLLVIYSLAFVLLVVRLYTGEPYRRLLLYSALANQWPSYDTDFEVPTNVRIGVRIIALLTNMIPLMLPLILSTFFNRLQMYQHMQQGAN